MAGYFPHCKLGNAVTQDRAISRVMFCMRLVGRQCVERIAYLEACPFDVSKSRGSLHIPSRCSSRYAVHVHEQCGRARFCSLRQLSGVLHDGAGPCISRLGNTLRRIISHLCHSLRCRIDSR
jgi:hypothetical protein